LLVTFCTFGQVFVLTLYFGDSLGYSIAFTGLAFLPLAALTFAASLVSGRLTERVGLRTPLVFGLALAGLGSLLLLAVGEHSSYTLFLAELSLIGIGSGFAIPPATDAVVSSAPDEKAGIASAVVNVSRQTGGVLGVALLGSLAGNEIVAGLHTAGFVCAGSFLVGAALSLACVRRAGESPPEEEREEAKEAERGS
ncbi:MAG: MFS transporter, partial [Actinobacteria bacterium]|nr:MFS transporter [Actinomycetota bacterium]